MECVIDTNALIYEMIEDSAHHKDAIAAFQKIKKRVVPSVVVEELVHALKQLNVRDEIISKKLEELLESEDTEIVPVQSSNLQDAKNLIAAHKVSFRRFNDKLVLSFAKNADMPLFTFDSELLSECQKEEIAVLY